MPKQAEQKDRVVQKRRSRDRIGPVETPPSPSIGTAHEPSPNGRPAKARRRPRRLWLGGATAILLVVIAVWGALHWRPAPRAAPKAAAPAAQEDTTELNLRRAVEANPNDARARMELGTYLQDHARPFEAMWEFAEAGHLASSEKEAPLRMAAVLRTGDVIALAAAQLSDAVRARPDDLEARRELAEIYLATAEPRRARSVMEERRDAVWQDAEAVVTLGRALHADGEAAEAVKAFKQSLSLQPEQHEAWYRLGRLYLGREQSTEARDAFFHAMIAHGSRPEYPYYVGMTYLQEKGSGNLERAIGFFKDALARKSSYSPAHYQQGVAVEQLHGLKKAVNHYSFAALADPASAEPNLGMGRCLISAGNKRDGHRYVGRYYDLTDRTAEAIREYEAMVAASPKSAQPVLLLSQVYTRTQQSAKAVAVLEAARKRLPDDIQLLERLAVMKINRGDRPYARRLLHRWLKLHPKASRPCWLLGRCDFGDLKYAEGVAWLEKAVAVQPKNPHYLGFLGYGLLRLNTPESLDRAAQALGQAVARAPESAEYRDLYGQVLVRLGRHEEARQQFLKALNVDPYRLSCFTAASQMAWRLNRPGPGEFLPKVIRAVQERTSEENLLWSHTWRNPNDAAGRLKLARMLCRTGQLEKARNHLEQALAMRPNWPEARQLMATVTRCQEAL